MKKVYIADAIIVKNKKLLLIQRSNNEDFPETWSFPGGVVNEKESIKTALKRELKEELGIKILNIIFFKSYVIKSRENFLVKAFYYKCSFSGEISISSDELVSYKWFDINNKLLNLKFAFNQKIVARDFINCLKK